MFNISSPFIPADRIQELLEGMRFDGFASGSQLVVKIPVLVSGGTVTFFKVIMGSDTFTTAGASITFAESFLYTPMIVFGINHNTANVDMSSAYSKDPDTMGFKGCSYFSNLTAVNWIAAGLHSEAL